MYETTQLHLILVNSLSGASGNDMDVYIDPLIDDLDSLWCEGIRTYDASRDEFFQLRAAIWTTITDFSGLGYLHGCATSGEVGCPHCHIETGSVKLKKRQQDLLYGAP